MFNHYKKAVVVLLSIIIFFSIFPNIIIGETSDYDIVIKNGTIFNPSTEHELENYNIGITDSKIERITQEELSGTTEIDADGLIISPGFIDLVSYDPNHVGIDFKILDGVTSNLAMHGGTEDAESWYASWEDNGVTANFGASSFITRMRWPIVGAGIDNEMTNQEDIDQLVAETRRNIEDGALGISFSFEYVPGIKQEVVPLLELAAEYDVPTFYHLRYSDEENGLDGIQEVIDYGEETGAAIHIMHINSTGGTFVMDQALEKVNNAREDGLDITTDFYPYDFWATYIDSARFRPGWKERFNITYEDLQIGATDIRITEETFAHYREQHLLVAAHGSMPEEELYMLLEDPNTMIGSDTIIEPSHNNHPRGAGTYSRLFGKYVREEQALTMMDAIKKVSYFPAKRMESAAPAMHYKGRIEVGADADITIFDSDTIIDKATVEALGTASVGVEYVLVNGVIVKDENGLVDVEKPGKSIQSYFVDDTTHNEPVDFQLTLDDQPSDIKNVYQIDDDIYLPSEEVFEQLDAAVVSSADGKINIEETLFFEIGSQSASINSTEIELHDEPIMYKEDIYISLNSLEQMLSHHYEVDINEDNLNLITKPTNIDSEDNEYNKETSSEHQEDQVEDESGGYFLVIALGLLAAAVALLIFYLVKKRK